MPHTMNVEMINPGDAEKMLATMVKNRPVSESKVLEYALAMEAGDWILNGETIKLDQFGHLIDGQHRLRACILSDKGFRSYVARGIEDAKAFATIDVGKTRSHKDVFSIAGFPNPGDAASAVMLIYGFKSGIMTWKTMEGRGRAKRDTPVSKKMKAHPGRTSLVSKDELLDYARPIQEGVVSALRAAHSSTFKKAQKLIPRATMAGLYYLFREKSFDDAERFFYDLGEGVGLQKTDPVYWLRERLQDNRNSISDLNRYTLIGLVIKAWNKRREGEEIKYLKVGDGEEFPKKIK